ncbi:MAG: hypothetical protein ABFS38_13565 [Bacteroidota bacterium]
MKTHLTIPVLIGLLLISCDCNDDDIQPNAGFEIFRVDTPYFHDIQKDYSTLDLDTIALEETPLLRYDDILKYDTGSHKLTLGISHDSLKIMELSFDEKYSSMFMVTLDNDPIYCGWFWNGGFSRPVNWVYIDEPHYEIDSLEDNEIDIKFHYQSDYWQKDPDPRLNPRIFERLAKDGKIE